VFAINRTLLGRKEIEMIGYLKKLLGAMRQTNKRRPAPRRVQLHVEAMEERMVPSTSPLGLAAPVMAQAGAATGGDIVLPDQCVHGYKWRRPHPWVALGGAFGQMQPPQVQFAALSVASQAVTSIVPGAADGMTVSLSAGHIVVTPPGGPLAAFQGPGW
jgi:hypothetical protein